jgi:hypothetical protein
MAGVPRIVATLNLHFPKKVKRLKAWKTHGTKEKQNNIFCQESTMPHPKEFVWHGSLANCECKALKRAHP